MPFLPPQGPLSKRTGRDRSRPAFPSWRGHPAWRGHPDQGAFFPGDLLSPPRVALPQTGPFPLSGVVSRLVLFRLAIGEAEGLHAATPRCVRKWDTMQLAVV